MVSDGRRGQIEWVVKDTRWLIRWIDPAKLKDRTDDDTALDEYDAPSLEVSRALLNGATPREAVEILRTKMMEEGEATLFQHRAKNTEV